MKTKYIVKSRTNPNLTLCTNGEFMAEGFFGPGHKIGAKTFVRIRNALKRGIIFPVEVGK